MKNNLESKIIENDKIPVSRQYKKEVFSQFYILGFTKDKDKQVIKELKN